MSKRSWRAEDIVGDLIVRRGLSYADAVSYCRQVAAPYLEVADELEAALSRAPKQKDVGVPDAT